MGNCYLIWHVNKVYYYYLFHWDKDWCGSICWCNDTSLVSICLHPTATFKGFFTSPCSSNWIGMYFIATIDKSHWKRIELITSSASKVHVRATHSGVPEWRWNVHHKVDLKCSNTAMVQSTMSWCLDVLKFVVTFVLPSTLYYNMAVKKKFCEKKNGPNPLSAKSVCLYFV